MTWIMLITIVFTALVSGGGAAYASENALPGDTLYPFKTMIENARLDIANDQGDFGLHLTYAEKRFGEVKALIQQKRFDDLAVAANGYEVHLTQLERLRSEAGPLGNGYGEMLAEQLRTRLETHARWFLESGDELPSEAQLQIRMMNQVQQRIQFGEPPDDAGPGPGGRPDGPGPNRDDTSDEVRPRREGAPGEADPSGEGLGGNSTPGSNEAPNGPASKNQDGQGNGTSTGPGQGNRK